MSPGPEGPPRAPGKIRRRPVGSRTLWALGGEKLRGPGPAWAHSASPLRVEKNFCAVEVPQGKILYCKK